MNNGIVKTLIGLFSWAIHRTNKSNNWYNW